jgi:hypothetical protein
VKKDRWRLSEECKIRKVKFTRIINLLSLASGGQRRKAEERTKSGGMENPERPERLENGSSSTGK